MSIGWMIAFALLVIGLGALIKYLVPEKYQEPCYIALAIVAGLILLYALLLLTGVPIGKPLG